MRRLHQEDLCQALGLTPDYKYHARVALPSFAALAQLLNDHGGRPGADRLAVAEATLFHYLVGNADAHAKNISLLHDGGRVRLSPLYDIVSTAAYPELTRSLSLRVGDAFDPEEVGTVEWDDFAGDLRLSRTGFRGRRRRLAEVVRERANDLREEARRDGWYDAVIDAIVATVDARVRRAIA